MKLLLALALCVSLGCKKQSAEREGPLEIMDDQAGIECATGMCMCSTGYTCNLECGLGDCSQRCAPDSTCTASCKGGRCSQVCEAGANCTLTCTGGGCKQHCEGPCTKSCAGSACN